MRGFLRFFKLLLVLAVIGGALTGVSYVGARATAGKMVGPQRPLQGRQIELAWKGTPDLQGNPRVWVFTYRVSQLPGVTSAKIYLSLKGEIIATRPRDLDLRLEAWERARAP